MLTLPLEKGKSEPDRVFGRCVAISQGVWAMCRYFTGCLGDVAISGISSVQILNSCFFNKILN